MREARVITGHLAAAGRRARNFNPASRFGARRGRDALAGRRRRGHVIESAVSARAVTAFDKVLGGP